MNSLSYLSSEAFSSIPHELVPDLQRMISTNESFRPTAIDFTGKYVNLLYLTFLSECRANFPLILFDVELREKLRGK